MATEIDVREQGGDAALSVDENKFLVTQQNDGHDDVSSAASTTATELVALPLANLSKNKEVWLAFPWFADDDAKQYQKYRDFTNPSLIVVLFTLVYIPQVVSRCNLSNLPTFNSYWSASFCCMLLISIIFYVHMGIRMLKNVNDEHTPPNAYLRCRHCLHSLCVVLKRLLELTGLCLPDLLSVFGACCVGFGLLGRVENGLCPPDVNLWTSQGCNPDAASNSIPTDSVAALYAVPLCVMVLFPGSSIQAILVAQLLCMMFMAIALAKLRGFLQSYTVFYYGFAYVLALIEIERIWRVSFLQHRAKMRLLEQLFPEYIIPKLINGESVEPTSHDDVCIFFSDICNFTELTHMLGPMATRSLVDELMLVMDECTQKNGKVWKVERVGDAYVCECGVVKGASKTSSSRLAENCASILAFALDVRERVSHLVNPLTNLPLQLRIGIQCGSCAAGLVGNQKIMPHFSLFGTLMNCAARLETTSTPDMIHVGEDVVLALRDWRDSRNTFVFSQRGIVDLKGLGKMTTYWLIGHNGKVSEEEQFATHRLTQIPCVSAVALPEFEKLKSLLLDNDAVLDFKFDVRLVDSESAEIITEAMLLVFCRLFDLHRIGINPITLRNFIRKIGQAYKDVPYHNFHHAFCVAQFTGCLYFHNIIKHLQVKQSLEQTMFASMIAVICHDVGHDGLNNGYHINSKSPLAKTFFNQSPLENHHISVTNAILGTHASNVFENWDLQFAEFGLNLISNSLLATDMKLHDEVLSDFAQYDPLLLSSSKVNFNPAPEAAEMLTFNVEQYELLKLSRLMLHAADISNSVRPFDISKTFVDKLATEFARQVEHERALGLPVTGFMVIPDQTAKAKGELYFLKYVSKPYFVALAHSFPNCASLLDTLDENVASWEAVIATAGAL